MVMLVMVMVVIVMMVMIVMVMMVMVIVVSDTHNCYLTPKVLVVSSKCFCIMTIYMYIFFVGSSI